MIQTIENQKGFSLIELMIAIAIFGVIVAAVVAAFQDQLKSNNTQQRVLAMQQNARAAMYYMTQELKLAGLDPTGNAGAGVLTANRNSIRFTMDFTGGYCDGDDDDDDGMIDEGCDPIGPPPDGPDENGNGLINEPDEWEWYDGDTADADEDITYWLSNDDGTGVCPVGAVCNLMRGNQILAVNIDVLNFSYLGRNPGDPGCAAGAINCPLPTPVPAANLGNIRSVQVSLIARDGAEEGGFHYEFQDNKTYYNTAEDIILAARNDGFRRYQLTSEIRCRNLGLE